MVDIEEYVSQDILDSLRAEFGQNKKIPAKFELQILEALSYYPDLKDVKVNFVERKVFAPLSALPELKSMFNPVNGRSYRVVISTKSAPEMERILLKNLPMNAQIGILGHELAHIIDYNTKSTTDLLAVAINYGINPVYHAWFEKSTDKRAIDHGLGWELYAYSKYVRTLFGSVERQVNLADDFYMHFNEILLEMQKSPVYNLYFQPNSIYRQE